MSCNERVDLVQEAIIEHLKNVGPYDWEEVKKDFLDIPAASFWRYVRKAKEQLAKPVVPDVATDLFAQAKQDKDRPEPWDKPKVNSVFRLLNHAQRFYELHSDLLALRQHALDADGRIRDAQLFAKSIRLRNQLLNDELVVTSGFNRADINTQFFDKVIEAISKASPEVAKAIMVELEAFNVEINRAEGSDAGPSIH